MRRPRRRLLHEGRLLRRLAHLHLARAYDVFTEPPAVILEVLTGRTLERRLEDIGRLSVAEVAAIGVQLCSVLQYLHRQPLLHLDIKPSNVVCERGVIKLIDLSIARRPGRSPRGTGTRAYMAPEQASGDIVSAATDVWGAGMLLFESVSGRRPFAPATAESPYPQLVECAAPVGGFRRRLPPALSRAIDASLSRVAADRPTVRELSALLESLAEAESCPGVAG
jgi:eukaryotic-like serine/threonine-protein kinase